MIQYALPQQHICPPLSAHCRSLSESPRFLTQNLSIPIAAASAALSDVGRSADLSRARRSLRIRKHLGPTTRTRHGSVVAASFLPPFFHSLRIPVRKRCLRDSVRNICCSYHKTWAASEAASAGCAVFRAVGTVCGFGPVAVAISDQSEKGGEDEKTEKK
jgi:hypothetical protein